MKHFDQEAKGILFPNVREAVTNNKQNLDGLHSIKQEHLEVLLNAFVKQIKSVKAEDIKHMFIKDLETVTNNIKKMNIETFNELDTLEFIEDSVAYMRAERELSSAVIIKEKFVE